MCNFVKNITVMTIISNEQAQYLMSLKKKILVDGIPANNLVIDQRFPVNIRYEIISEADLDFVFLWEIKQSSKNSFQLSLHYQENDSKIGLIRVDYNKGHKNPDTDNGQLPSMFVPYIGKWFDNTESHVHYHVDGYKTLAWAVPIAVADIVVKELGEVGDLNLNIKAAIENFAQIINLETIVSVNAILI